MPGVARAPFGLGLLIVRGANPTDTGVFIGGEPIPVLYHFLAGPSVFTANLIDKIDFYPGGFGVRYGRFIGGVVDVKHQERRRPHAARRGRHQPARLVGVRGGSGAGRRAHELRRRRSYIDALLPLVLPYFVPSRVGFDLLHRRAGVLGLSGAGGQGPPGRRAGRPARVRQQRLAGGHRGGSDRRAGSNTHIGFHHVMGEWVTLAGRLELAPVGDLRLRRSELLDRHLRRLPALSPPVGARGLQPALQPALAVAAGLDFVLSYDWAHYDNLPFPRDGRTIGTTMPPQMVDVDRSLYDTAPAVYVEAQLEHHAAPAPRPRPALRLLPRGRDRQVLVDPRLAFRWELTPRLALKGAVGIYHQLPNPQFLDRVTATRTCCCPGPISTRSASSGGSPRPTS